MAKSTRIRVDYCLMIKFASSNVFCVKRKKKLFWIFNRQPRLTSDYAHHAVVFSVRLTSPFPRRFTSHSSLFFFLLNYTRSCVTIKNSISKIILNFTLGRGPLRRHSASEVLLFVTMLLLLLRTVRSVRRRTAPAANFDHVMRTSPVLDRLIRRRVPVFLLFEVLPVVVRMIAENVWKEKTEL